MDENVHIIPYYAHPHVFTVINDNTFYDEAVGTPEVETMPYATAVVTGADSGRDNVFIRCDSLGKKKAIFGTGDYKKYGQSSIQADVLFNGSTSVWFYRCLPDNATYANAIVLAKFRKGNELDESGQATGFKRLEVKLDVVYAAKPDITDGATTDSDVRAVAESYASETPDASTGYMCLPLGYARIDGRGKYGNNYGLNITRDLDAEKEYAQKMYAWSLVKTGKVTAVANIFSGGFYQQAVDGVSTLIDDVMTKFEDGTCPLSISTFEDNFLKIYDFYKEIVAENAGIAESTEVSDEDVANIEFAQEMTEGEFDPVFGLKYLTRASELIPFYKNYTAVAGAEYVAPDKTVAAIANRPANKTGWDTAAVGMTCLVTADATHENLGWLYTITAISAENAITYDEGVYQAPDADQYDGFDITTTFKMIGGSDGSFEEVTVDDVTRKPNASEMKLLLAREQVKAFRGEKDKRILSPYRINLDFIFDANYNMFTGYEDEEGLSLQDSIRNTYGNSTILTDDDYRTLAVLGAAEEIDTSDLDVKKAIYDLVKFRNKNGMPNAPDEGAGCSVNFDCGLLGLKSNSGEDLNRVIDAFDGYTGRAFSVDLGYYEIFEPKSGRKVPVTIGYFLAENLIPFIMTNGMNAVFTHNKASLNAVQNSAALIAPGSMIRDTFKPDIDTIDWDVKEKLYNSRINYWETTDEGRYIQRACQNTRQLDASALLEENNVRVLNTLKKRLENAARGYLYGWNTATARAGYTKTQMDAFRPWIGNYVQDLNIYFAANQFEQKRMLMHCYCDVAFFDITKRIILEININRPASENGGE